MLHHYNQIDKPSVKLNGIEYLLLSIQSNPGKSQRWHLRRKHMYLHGRPDYHKGGSGSGYFISASYRNVTWTDKADKSVFYPCALPSDAGFWHNKTQQYGGMKPSRSQMHLTRHGWKRANKARTKLGLEPIPFVQVN